MSGGFRKEPAPTTRKRTTVRGREKPAGHRHLAARTQPRGLSGAPALSSRPQRTRAPSSAPALPVWGEPNRRAGRKRGEEVASDPAKGQGGLVLDTIFGLPVHILVIHAVVLLVPLCAVGVIVAAI